MTISEYLIAKVKVSLSEDNISVVLLDRGYTDTFVEAHSFDVKTRELFHADSLMLIATAARQSGGESHSHGGFSYKQGSQTIDRDAYVKQAMEIYKKYGDDKFSDIGSVRWMDNDY